jgi:hypothetical protein
MSRHFRTPAEEAAYGLGVADGRRDAGQPEDPPLTFAALRKMTQPEVLDAMRKRPDDVNRALAEGDPDA